MRRRHLSSNNLPIDWYCCEINWDSICVDEANELCTVEPSQECGNGAVEEPEQCDDGNIADGDGCSANCTIEQDDNDVPEFGIIGAGIALVAAAGVLLYRRKQ